MVTILVVDDVSSEKELISLYLEDSGYQTIKAANGKDALEKAINNKPDLIISDVVMPEMSGLELCRNLKKSNETQKIPIILCTSKNQEIDRLWGMKQGAIAYITKPFTKEEILNTVKKSLL